MTLPMKGQLQVATPGEYLARLEEPRRSEVTALHNLIRERAPLLEPYIQSGMLGYGKYHYEYASGRSGDWCRIALASNAQSLSLYAMAADDRGYVAERFKARLPRASIGKSCVRIKRLGDVDLAVIAELIEATARMGYSLEDRRGSSDGTSAKAERGGKSGASGRRKSATGRAAKSLSPGPKGGSKGGAVKKAASAVARAGTAVKRRVTGTTRRASSKAEKSPRSSGASKGPRRAR